MFKDSRSVGAEMGAKREAFINFPKNCILIKSGGLKGFGDYRSGKFIFISSGEFRVHMKTILFRFELFLLFKGSQELFRYFVALYLSSKLFILT